MEVNIRATGPFLYAELARTQVTQNAATRQQNDAYADFLVQNRQKEVYAKLVMARKSFRPKQ